MKKQDIITTPSFFRTYIQKAPDLDIIEALKATADLTGFIPEQALEKYRDYAYAPGKWTVAEVLQHIIDTERVFAYRALRFGRNDTTELPGFDENLFAQNADVSHRTIEDLLEEFNIVRKGTILMFKGFTDEALLRKGISNKNEIDVLALGFTAAGHVVHHTDILKQRYFTT